MKNESIFTLYYKKKSRNMAKTIKKISQMYIQNYNKKFKFVLNGEILFLKKFMYCFYL